MSLLPVQVRCRRPGCGAIAMPDDIYCREHRRRVLDWRAEAMEASETQHAAELRAKDARIEELEGSLQEWQADFKALERDNADLRAANAEVQAANNAWFAKDRELEAEVARLTEAVGKARDELERARASTTCENGSCPACGGSGPSGEWHEGDEVMCDDCGMELVVDTCAPCFGSSTFSKLYDEDGNTP